jgi:hypothetical protein
MFLLRTFGFKITLILTKKADYTLCNQLFNAFLLEDYFFG